MERYEIPTSSPERPPEFSPVDVEPAGDDFSPVLLSQLQDELSRSRMREAFWISLVLHLALFIAVATSPKWMPQRRVVQLQSAEDLIRNRDLTFLELPPDKQAPAVKPPDTKYLSDKNRIASSRNPEIDRKTLEQLRNARPPGPPAPAGPPAQQVQPAPGPQPQRPQQQQQPSQMASAPPSGAAPNLPAPAPKNPFGAGGVSAGSSIDQAIRGSSRVAAGGGVSGDYGMGVTPSGGKVRSNIDVLSDTMGVDFGPYLARVLQSVRMNWYNLIPEVARPPLMKQGKVAIEFAILPDGKIAGMRIIGPSGDVALDRAAWGGITASNPFAPLPREFHGPYIALRFHFVYNPDRNSLD